MVKQFIIAILVFFFTAFGVGAVKGADVSTSMGHPDSFGNPFFIHSLQQSEFIR